MNRPVNVTPELLSEHASSLRGLARRLLGDAHAAEDVVQETWITALERPPRTLERFGSWLRAVARGLALRRLRGEDRRRRREQRGARAEAGDPADETAERRQALRRLTDAVLSLDEPYQTAILLRFFDDLPPRAIAERLGVPVATVKSRLARGLERLRARLAAECEEDGTTLARALAFLVPPATPTVPGTEAAAASAGAGVIVMGTKLKLAASIAVIALGAIAWQETRTRAVDPARPDVVPAADPRGVAAAVAPRGLSEDDDGPAPGSERRAVASPLTTGVPDESGPPLADGYRYELAGTVFDRDDVPLAGALVYVGPLGHPLNKAVETDSHGRFHLSWNGRAPSMRVALAVSHDGKGWSGLRRYHLGAGHNELALGLPATGTRTATLSLREEGEPAPVTLAAYVRTSFAAEGAELRHHHFGDAPGFEHDEDGHGFFRQDRGDGACPTIGFVHLQTLRGFEYHELNIQRITSAQLAVLLEQRAFAAERPPRAVLTGVVRDAVGKPAVGALVRLKEQGGDRVYTTRSDATGAYRIEDVAPAAYEARAGGGDHGLANGFLVAGDTGELVWEPYLDRGLELAGRLVDRDGAALDGWLVEVVGAADAWHDAATADGDGRFRVPNCPNRPLRLLVRPPSDWGAVPAAVIDAWPEGEERVYTLDPRRVADGEVRFVVQDHRERPCAEVEVRLWHLESGVGAWLTPAEDNDESGAFAAALPAGDYWVEVQAPRCSPIEFGPVRVTAGGVTDLGIARFEEPGAAHFVLEARSALDVDRWRFELWNLRDDVRTAVFREGLCPPKLSLPAGEYELLVTPNPDHEDVARRIEAGAPPPTRAYRFHSRSGERVRSLIQFGAGAPVIAEIFPKPAPEGPEPPAAQVKKSVEESARAVIELRFGRNCAACHGGARENGPRPLGTAQEAFTFRR